MQQNKTLQDIQIAEQNGNAQRLTINDLNMSCYYPQSSFIQEDDTCNSQFMLHTMPTIGTEIRQQMPWIPQQEPIYLFLDNAGGHRSKSSSGKIHKTVEKQVQYNYKISNSTLTRSKFLELGHLDKLAIISQAQALEQMTRH